MADDAAVGKGQYAFDEDINYSWSSTYCKGKSEGIYASQAAKLRNLTYKVKGFRDMPYPDAIKGIMEYEFKRMHVIFTMYKQLQGKKGFQNASSLR